MSTAISNRPGKKALTVPEEGVGWRLKDTATMKQLGPLLILSVLGSSSPGFAALPEPHTVLRGHKHEVVVFTNDPVASIADADFVFAYGPAARPQRIIASIFGYLNESFHGEPVTTVFFRLAPTLGALATLETRIAALGPAEMPSACDLDRGPFTTGTYELTLYNGAAGPAQIITVTFHPNAPAAAQCPANVETLVASVDGFLRFEGFALP